MRTADIRALNEYHHWANGRIPAALTQVGYTCTSGEPRSQIFWQLLVHIVNHGTQHHTEAALLLTGYGASPGNIDLHLSPLGQTNR